MNDSHIKKYNLDEIDINIAKKMRERRLELGLTQDYIANILGLNRSTIAQMEIGRNKLNHQTLSKIAVILKKPVSYFIGDEAAYFQDNTLRGNKKDLEKIVNNWKIKEFLENKHVSKEFLDELHQTLDYLCELYNVDITKLW